MFGAAEQLSGFVRTGEIRTTRLFRQSFSNRQLRAESGRGGKLII